MDISMPVMNGYEATMEIRELEKKFKMPKSMIIALSAHTTEVHKKQARNAKMNQFSKI